jgi:predicted PurR-regulated permease PerM
MSLFLGLGLLQGISLFARPLAFFLLGVAIATALAPLTNQLARWLPRTLAVIAIYLVLALLFALLGWLVLPPLFNGVQEFGNALPTVTVALQEWLTEQNAVDGVTLLETLSGSLAALGPRLLALPVAVTSFWVNALLVFFISLYALLVAPAAQDFALSLLPENQRGYVQRVLHDMSKAMGGYVRGAFLSGVAVGLLTYVGLLLIEVPFPLVLAVIAGVLEIIPILGPIVAGVLIIGVALTQSLEQALFALGFSIVLQQVEGNIIFPNVMSRETEMSPLLSIVAFLAGSAVGGLLGALVAIPLAAAARVFVVEVVAPYVRRWSGAV